MIDNRETDVTYGLTIEGGVRRLKQLPEWRNHSADRTQRH